MKTSMLTFKKYYSVIFNFVQVKNNQKINDSYVKVNIDKRIGKVDDFIGHVLLDAFFSSIMLKRNEVDYREELIHSIKELNALLFLLDESNINWNYIKVEAIDDEQFIVENVPYSLNDIALARHTYTVKNEKGDNHSISIWEFSLLYDNVYIIISYDYNNKNIVNTIEMKNGYHSYDTFSF
ncbi:hypothetical protein BCR36DRAFT_366237 [Piromyces finnis]|uniref:Uncharacterized protein n=1 Tax=Piromyces finnis TaxID=1754191 RepID=A0A1Y1VNM4_9FUNG|nr:hypothetical protein BCR36DRAFT_366237 [Piromyces finnis]|eukprot:ORX60231.1 hypothetical protein BCR36DRAFT_366237 [Piromyces finnis]